MRRLSVSDRPDENRIIFGDRHTRESSSLSSFRHVITYSACKRSVVSCSPAVNNIRRRKTITVYE